MRTGSCARLLSLALALPVVAFCAAAAHADGGTNFAFVWRAPAGCPSASAVEEEIAHLLGGPIREHARNDLRVQAVVQHESAWLVTLETSANAGSGHRTIEAATCQALAHATALIVALLTDPDAVSARAAKPPDSEPQPQPPPAEAAPVQVAPVAVRAVRLLLGAAAAGNVGVLPSPDIEASASVGIVRPRWRLEARVAYGPRQLRSDAVASPSGAHGRVSLNAGTLAGCMTFSRPLLELGPCADVEFGALHGEGIRATSNESHTSPWLGLGVGGLVAIRLTRWLYLPVHVDAVVPLWRPRYVFENVPAPIFRSAPVGGRLTAGVELRF
jgi:hypothetical protein